MKHWIPLLKSQPVVSVIRLSGMIAAGTRATATLSDEALAPLFERAFRRGRPKAVALVINSPGGSPVQSSLIAARIRRLSAEKSVPVYAFVEDVAASGGYWLATAADEIWLDENSIVGSIGVISASFGFPELMKRQGIERRVYTAGESKSMLDPFQPEKPEDVARLRELQDQIHHSFIAQVKSRRGLKLAKGTELFDGTIWVGTKAVELGIADGIGHLVPKMKALFGDKVRLIPYTVRRPFFQRFGVRIIDEALSQVEERAQYARFGL